MKSTWKSKVFLACSISDRQFHSFWGLPLLHPPPLPTHAAFMPLPPFSPPHRTIPFFLSLSPFLSTLNILFLSSTVSNCSHEPVGYLKSDNNSKKPKFWCVPMFYKLFLVTSKFVSFLEEIQFVQIITRIKSLVIFSVPRGP